MMEKTAEFSAKLENLESVRTFIADFMRSQQLSEEQIYNFELAADEHFTNLIEHAFRFDDQRFTTITCSFDDSKAQVIIADDSEGFDPRHYSIPDLEETPIYEIPPGGLGNYFICELMDQVDYIQNPNIENKLILTVYKNS